MNAGMVFSVFDSSFWDSLWSGFVIWFTGINWTKFAFNFVLVALFIFITILIVSFLIERQSDERFDSQIHYASSTVRVFKIDGPKNTVLFFNLSEMRTPRKVTIEEFYAHFPSHEQKAVRDWITAILDGQETTAYLQTDVSFHRLKRDAPSFLRISKSDPTKGLIHLESYLLQYREPAKANAAKSLSTEGDFSEFLKANGTSIGMTFCFTLLPKIISGQTGNEEQFKQGMPKGLSLAFKNALLPYIQGNQKLIQASDNEYVVANFDMSDPTQAISFALRATAGANAVIAGQKKRSDPEYEVRVGIVSNKDLLGDSDAILTEARKAASTAFETTSSLSFYRKGSEDYSPTDILNFKSEVERIIYEKKISYSYRPVYCASKKRIYGYLGRATPINCSFSTIDELRNYAVRAKDDKNLFNAIAKNLIPRFVAEREVNSQKLFYPVRVSEMSNLAPSFSHYKPAKDANLVVVFDENDLMTSVEPLGLDAILSALKDIHDAGFLVTVMISGKTLLLDPTILEVMDGFFVDFSSPEDETNMDTKIRSQLHALVEKLLKYRKPIIANSLTSWNAIELVVGSGIDYVSSDTFCPYGEMLVPITEKNEARLLAMAERK
jgi:hypothetical protein